MKETFIAGARLPVPLPRELKLLRRVLLVGVVALALAPASHAGEIIDRAVDALGDDPVYVDPEAKPTLTPAQERELEATIEDAGNGPIFVAVLPAAVRAEAGGDATEGAEGSSRTSSTGRGRYAIVAGGQFRAGSLADSSLGRGQASRLATDAFAGALPRRARGHARGLRQSRRRGPGRRQSAAATTRTTARASRSSG